MLLFLSSGAVGAVCVSEWGRGQRCSPCYVGYTPNSSGFFLLNIEIILVGRPQCFTRNSFHQMDVSLDCFNFTESSSEDDHAWTKKNLRFFLLGKQPAPLRSSDVSLVVWVIQYQKHFCFSTLAH